MRTLARMAVSPRRLRVCALFASALIAAGCGRRHPEDQGGKGKAAAPPPPPVVTVAAAVQRNVPLVSELVGTLQGYLDVEIRARVAGFLQSQNYQEGSFVQRGQLLFTIDPRQYVAAVDQAKAALARARANAVNARVAVRRLRPLVKINAVSRQDYDTARANALQADAEVRAAAAALKQAQLYLSYTRITSPLSGLAGAAQVRIGNLVGQGSPTLLATVSQVDPIRVVFSVPEREYLSWTRGAGADAGTTGPNPRLQLLLANGEVWPYPGTLVFAKRAVNPATGTLTLEAIFPNPQRRLRPGQYARVRLQQKVLKNAVLVPQLAINPLQGLSRVGVVGPDDVVHVRTVTPGPKVGGEVVIERGISPGERVIVEGFEKAKDGEKVNPRPAAQQPDAGVASPGVGGAGPSGAQPAPPGGTR